MVVVWVIEKPKELFRLAHCSIQDVAAKEEWNVLRNLTIFLHQ